MASPLRFSAAEARAILASRNITCVLFGNPDAGFSRAAIDSRKAGHDCIFVALVGEKADGHDFARAALASGASVLLVEKESWSVRRASLEAALAESGGAVLSVDAVLPAFQALAKAKRLGHPGLRRVGITGSSGKTTTKEIIASILSNAGKVVMNPGNLNSDQGLALSLFGIEGDEDFGVFEMGMNRAGEMDELAAMYEPDFALITNVGTAHIGILGSRQAIAKEKKQIFSRFDGRQVGFVGEGDDFRDFLREDVRGEMVDFGERSTAGYRGAEDLGLDGWTIDWEGLRIRFPFVGRHSLDDALAALSLSARMGIRTEAVAAGLEALQPLSGRSEILRGRVTVVSDCYNANPESSEAAIDFCDSLSWKGRRLYVFGSMLELGTDSDAAHRRMGEVAARSKASALLFFGDETRAAWEEVRARGWKGFLHHDTSIERLGIALRSWVREGDLVLLKASRGMALERLLDSIPR
ncbi:MAG: UDP-N-acetylmuramoyl-tripeptide--D-alanyl-D-alanine ligase [Spirochaetota bacterium]